MGRPFVKWNNLYIYFTRFVFVFRCACVNSAMPMLCLFKQAADWQPPPQSLYLSHPSLACQHGCDYTQLKSVPRVAFRVNDKANYAACTGSATRQNSSDRKTYIPASDITRTDPSGEGPGANMYVSSGASVCVRCNQRDDFLLIPIGNGINGVGRLSYYPLTFIAKTISTIVPARDDVTRTMAHTIIEQ